MLLFAVLAPPLPATPASAVVVVLDVPAVPLLVLLVPAVAVVTGVLVPGRPALLVVAGLPAAAGALVPAVVVVVVVCPPLPPLVVDAPVVDPSSLDEHAPINSAYVRQLSPSRVMEPPCSKCDSPQSHAQYRASVSSASQIDVPLTPRRLHGDSVRKHAGRLT